MTMMNIKCNSMNFKHKNWKSDACLCKMHSHAEHEPAYLHGMTLYVYALWLYLTSSI